ncbi:MAG: hypothetical protein HY291_13845 [Planctomycetes bacterium]|nr:hypothetical protein [Planctomycetota bacterium]
MGLIDGLKNLGSKLRIVQSVRILPAAQPEKTPTRSVTLAELTGEIRAEEIRALAGLPEELSVPFEKVYEAAGIKPGEGGWTIFTIKELVEKEPFKSMDRLTAQKMLHAKLVEAQVPAEEVVKDAVSRDQALDAFEASLRAKLDARDVLRHRKIAECEAQIERLKKEAAVLATEAQEEKKRIKDWKTRKRAEEKLLATAVSYLLDQPVISTDSDE